ncbi:hypothetical protein JOC54_000970 [Alkalihalobacillus xiaoxiensis]|uniref:Uncharacterized protein n=1 Tax=Shouchella xiaoxiensis TaxID=766895 RepID=A0ABS2SQE0_9BACI|nr:hypothetical protein [Shouchella xiaoxiensis]MBM7837739.1 hypothetical protein [Shouchella xiaoxiensis]
MNFFDKVLQSKQLLGVLALMVVVLGVVASCMIEKQHLRGAIQLVVQINITTVIGIGAIMIALKDIKKKFSIIKESMVIILFSLIGLFVSLIPFELIYEHGFLIHRLYLLACSLLIASLIASIGKQIYTIVDGN